MRGIYAIVDAEHSSDLASLVATLLEAGIRLVQYRAKSGVDRDLVRALRARTLAAGASLVVNDDLEAALEADGLHVGQADLTRFAPLDLRTLLGGRLLGISAATPEEARRAESIGADYLGVGPFAATSSKADARRPIGVAGVRAVVLATHVPVAAIGGIELENLAQVAASGAAMAASIAAVARGTPAGSEARALVERWAELTR